jgi:hypothetical protein
VASPLNPVERALESIRATLGWFEAQQAPARHLNDVAKVNNGRGRRPTLFVRVWCFHVQHTPCLDIFAQGRLQGIRTEGDELGTLDARLMCRSERVLECLGH